MVNDRVDLAVLQDVDGVHVGNDDLPAPVIRNHWPGLTIGHTVRVDQDPPSAADHLSLGPYRSPASKSLEKEPCGAEGVHRVLSQVDRPLYVIGGLRPEDVPDLPTGIAGVCVIGSVWKQPDPVAAVQRWRRALDERTA